MLDSALAVDNLDELALLTDLESGVLVRASDDELGAAQLRAELGERQNLDLDASSRHDLAYLVALLRAHLLLHNSVQSLAHLLEDELGLADLLPNPNALVEHLDLLAHLSVRDLHLLAILVRDLFRDEDAMGLAHSFTLLERAVNFGGHLLDN